MGLGKELFDDLREKEDTFGITSKKSLANKNIIYLPYFDSNQNLDQLFNKLSLKLIEINFSSISVFFNSALYDKKDDNYFDKIKIINVNYFNQMLIYEFLKNKFSDKKFKLIFFSSFEIYNNKSKLNFYKLSKQMFIEEYESKKYDKNIIIKLFIIGGIRTSTYNKNISTKKRSLLRKFLASDLKKSKEYILSETKKNVTKKYFYPARYYYLNILRKFIKYV